MDIGDQFSLEHLLFKERVCRSCGKKKNLIEDFYMTRRSKKGFPSAYAYECKDCTVERIRDFIWIGTIQIGSVFMHCSPPVNDPKI